MPIKTEHPKCYDQAKGLTEKIGFLDIETYGSNFNAPFGMVLTYCIKELDGEILKGSITREDLYHRRFDKPLLKRLVKDLLKFDRVIVHYGTDRKFDIPFARTRALKHRIPFPAYKFLYATDTWNILKNKFKFGSNRLGYACNFLGISAKNHPLREDIWQDIVSGNEKYINKALSYIMVHNIEDVISTEKLWKRIGKFTKLAKTSI